MTPVSKSLAEFIKSLKSGNAEFGIPPHNAPELLDRWSISMETQINVIASMGTPVEDQKGVFEDKHGNRFWNIRIPKGANTETPTFNDYPTPYPFVMFAQGIGCTGWDWQAKVSRWVGFDFDAITGHAAGVGVSGDELERVKDAACALPWVEVRNSTGGNGLHLNVLLDAIPTATHTEHAALARCILGMMATEAGFDFARRIDACGGNMWIWHRKMTTQNRGLSLIKAAECSLGSIDLPVNWKDHIEVVKRRRSKVAVQGAEDDQSFDKLAAAQQSVVLEDSHKKILEELRRLPYACEWVADHNCARIHTVALAELMDRIKIKGVYQTNSEGRDPSTANGFMFPLPGGGWRVFRFSPGIQEAPTWTQDGEGWTTCTYNVPPDLRTAARASGGKFDGDRDGFYFDHAKDAIEAVRLMGAHIDLPDEMAHQDAFVKVDKTGHVSIDIAAKEGYQGDMRQWTEKKKQKRWSLTTDLTVSDQPTSVQIDGIARLVKTPSMQDAGWHIRGQNGEWSWTSKDNVKQWLIRNNVKKSDIDYVMGEAVGNWWKLVNLPFQPDYPGGRQINFGAPQYRYQPAETDGEHPHWDLILSHCFQDLDGPIKTNEWARQNNIITGRDYGLAWIACLLREPFEPLPYLFLFSEEQNTGKSILWESLLLLITNGVVDASKALRTNTDFNGELANAVLAYIEEVDLSGSGSAYNRMKAWVTSPTLSIRKMRTDAYEQANTLHFIHTANSPTYCPILPGDSRVTMLYVPRPKAEIPKSVLKQRLMDEAPQFMRTIMNLQLPSVSGRLRVPVIETESKLRAETSARTDLESFIDERCVEAEGEVILFSEFYSRFQEWLPPEAQSEWNRKRTSLSLPSKYATVKLKGKHHFVRNLKWKTEEETQ